jgi:HEPN domain-containing protein
MINSNIAYAYVKQASVIYNEAEALFHKGIWNMVVRRSQEVVELSLKALLRECGIEIPHLHDVSSLLKLHNNKLPPYILENLDKISSISRRLRQQREISFYGEEENDTAPEKLYSKLDAKDALLDADFVLNIVKTIFKK